MSDYNAGRVRDGTDRAADLAMRNLHIEYRKTAMPPAFSHQPVRYPLGTGRSYYDSQGRRVE